MAGFLGQYPCKLDNKGRIKIPTGLKKQFDPEIKGRFVISRGFEKCLILYPINEWRKITAKLDKLNMFVRKNREFVRYFYRGATELQLDNADRLLLPKHLLGYANIDKETLLTAQSNTIEIWDHETYEGIMSGDSDEFADLAEEVMGNLHEDGAPESNVE